MADLDMVEQLINSMNESLIRMEVAYASNDLNYVNRLRVFIFNVYQKIDSLLGG